MKTSAEDIYKLRLSVLCQKWNGFATEFHMSCPYKGGVWVVESNP